MRQDRTLPLNRPAAQALPEYCEGIRLGDRRGDPDCGDLARREFPPVKAAGKLSESKFGPIIGPT